MRKTAYKTHNSSVSDIGGASVSRHMQNSHSINIKHIHVITIITATNSRISVSITFIIGRIYLNPLRITPLMGKNIIF